MIMTVAAAIIGIASILAAEQIEHGLMAISSDEHFATREARPVDAQEIRMTQPDFRAFRDAQKGVEPWPWRLCEWWMCDVAGWPLDAAKGRSLLVRAVAFGVFAPWMIFCLLPVMPFLLVLVIIGTFMDVWDDMR